MMLDEEVSSYLSSDCGRGEIARLQALDNANLIAEIELALGHQAGIDTVVIYCFFDLELINRVLLLCGSEPIDQAQVDRIRTAWLRRKPEIRRRLTYMMVKFYA